MKLLHKKSRIILAALLSLLGTLASADSLASSPQHVVNVDPNSRPFQADSSNSLIYTETNNNNNNNNQQQQQQLQDLNGKSQQLTTNSNNKLVQSTSFLAKIDNESPLSATKFDVSNFKSVYAAIRNHPNLRTVSWLHNPLQLCQCLHKTHLLCCFSREIQRDLQVAIENGHYARVNLSALALLAMSVCVCF